LFYGKYNFYLYECNTKDLKMSDVNKQRASSPSNIITNENPQLRNNTAGKYFVY